MGRTVDYFIFFELPKEGNLSRLDYLTKQSEFGHDIFLMNDTGPRWNNSDLKRYEQTGALKKIRNPPEFNANNSVWLDYKGDVYYASTKDPFNEKDKKLIGNVNK